MITWGGPTPTTTADLNPPTYTIHRTTAWWSLIAALLAWIWTVGMAYEIGRTDRAVMIAKDSEARMHAARVRAWEER